MGDIIILNESRKTFFFGYLLLTLFAASVIYLKVSNFNITNQSLTISAVVIITGLFIPEIVRRWETVTIRKDKIDISSGILRKKHRKFFANTITDIHIKQSFWQRILNYGGIKVHSFAQHNDISLGTVSNPKKRVEEMEKLFGENIGHAPRQ
jgi:uncharacterized membrane protein YdbT with pleckstrin-like domain